MELGLGIGWVQPNLGALLFRSLHTRKVIGIFRVGAMGMGMLSKLTIVRADTTQGTVEETFEFPYALIKFSQLQQAIDNNFILGYRIEKIIPADDQPIMFKIGSPQDGEQ